MEEYEYKTLVTKAFTLTGSPFDQDPFQEKLNELGMMGWELVNTVAVDRGSNTMWLLSIFKRRV